MNALQIFNRLAYKKKFNRPLTTSYLLNLPNYYNHNIKLRCFNLNLICYYFINIIFYKSSIFQLLKDEITFISFTQPPICIFKYYWCRGPHLFEFCLYTYFATILVVKCTKFRKQIFKFENLYLHKSDLIQKYHLKPDSYFLITFISNLFQCQFEENDILDGNLDTISP